jgi:hypothetical protein
MTAPQQQEAANPKTGMTLTEMKNFVRNHFEEFVNRQNLEIGDCAPPPQTLEQMLNDGLHFNLLAVTLEEKLSLLTWLAL